MGFDIWWDDILQSTNPNTGGISNYSATAFSSTSIGKNLKMLGFNLIRFEIKFKTKFNIMFNFFGTKNHIVDMLTQAGIVSLPHPDQSY